MTQRSSRSSSEVRDLRTEPSTSLEMKVSAYCENPRELSQSRTSVMDLI